MKEIFNRNRRLQTVLMIMVFAFASIALTGAGTRNFEITRNLDIFSTLFRELVVNYVDDINVSEVMRKGVDEMLESLDPYTVFISEAEIEDVRFMTTGQYGGIGARVHQRNNLMMVTEAYQGFPAYKAGLQPGDILLEINGQTLEGRSEDEVRTFLQGQPGTTINVLIERDGRQSNKSLEREVIRIPNIPHYSMLDESTAYIKLTGFTRRAGREVGDALQELREENDVQHVILDLRGNGGGLLHEAVNIANLFLEKGNLIVNTKGRLEDRTSRHSTLNDPLDIEIPLVVLVDRASASASEIVTGAIQDYDRGVVIGNRTFGKGLVQNVVPLSYNTQLKITVAEYFIPSGRGIQAINYAERRPDGSVYKIPDSLQMAFETRGGRKVYDGGGIDPDIAVERAARGALTNALQQQYMIFDFANIFFNQNESITEPNSFFITDDIYNDFEAFLDSNDYSYETDSERILNRLKDAAERENYYDAVAPDISRLVEVIDLEKSRDLITFRTEIEQLLREEIVSRYYYRKGRVIVTLDDDPDVERALQLFSDLNAYEAILAGKN